MSSLDQCQSSFPSAPPPLLQHAFSQVIRILCREGHLLVTRRGGIWFFLALPNRFAVSSLSFPSFLVLLPLVFFFAPSLLPSSFVFCSLFSSPLPSSFFFLFPSLFLSPPSRPFFFFFFFSLSSSFGTFCGGGWFVDFYS